MVTQASGTFRGVTWDEAPYSEIEGGPKLTHAHVTNTYEGDVTGESVGAYVMVYPGEIAIFAGYERITGAIGGRKGSFVLRHDGTWEQGVVRTTWTIVPGSGTGDLAGVVGSGSYTATHEVSDTPFTLTYSFDGDG